MSQPNADELRDAVDEIAIRGLISTYADVVNRRAWPELEPLFLADAPIVLDLGDRPAILISGPGALGDFIDSAIERFAFFQFVALNVHVMGRHHGDPDRATIRTYMCELRQGHDGTPSRAFGLYQDSVTRSKAGWRFAERRYRSVARGEHTLDLLPWPDVDAT